MIGLDEIRAEEPLALSLAEAADLLRVDRHTLVDLVKQGRLAAVRIGRKWRFSKRAIVRFLEEGSDGQ